MPVEIRNAGRRLQRFVRSWQAPALLGALLLLGILWWLSPWTMHVRVEWNPANLYWAASLWWLWLISASLIIGALVARRYARGRVLASAWNSRFFLGSVAVHALLLVLLAWWTLPTVVRMIVTQTEVEPLPDVHNNQQRPGEDGRQAFERVADIEETDPAPTDAVTRADAAPAPNAERLENLAPTIPATVARTLPPERVLFAPPVAEAPEVVPPQAVTPPVELLVRKTTVPVPVARDLNVAEEPQLAAVESPAEAPINMPTELNRDALPIPRDHAPGPPQLGAERVPQLPSAVVMDHPEAVEQPTITTPAAPTMLSRQSIPVVREVAEVSEDITLPPAAAATVAQADDVAPTAEQLALGRQEISGPVAPQRPTPQPETGLPVTVLQPASTGTVTIPDGTPSTSATPPTMPLARRAPTMVAAVDPLTIAPAPDIPLAATEVPEEAAVARTEVVVTPEAAQPLTRTAPMEMAALLPRRTVRTPSVAALDVELPPTPDESAAETTLERAMPSTGRVALAEDRVDLPSMFALRDEETRRQYIELFGGTPATEEAVNRGLEWLAQHQNPGGSWSLHKFHVPEGQSANIPGAGGERSDTAATGLALLAFLGGRHTHQSGRYQPVVAAAIKWLIEHQKEDGDLLADGDNQRMYSHGIATIALCEAYGISRDEALKEPARKALDFIVKAQHPQGGWRYNPGEPGDTSVVGWQMMALKSGEMAGIPAPPAVMDRLRNYLSQVEGNKPVGGQFGYQGPSPTPAMTAEGLLCLQFLGENRNSLRMKAGTDYLLKHLPEPTQALTSYYWYYGTQVMYHMQGDYWDDWNAATRDLLVETQIKDGPLAGTWEPRDQWEQRGGRLFSTTLKLLMLEVYYRHLPLYEQLDD